MSVRAQLGLRPKNSPSLNVLQPKKSIDSLALGLSPSKHLKKPPISPAAFSTSENKENIEIQTIPLETASCESQTVISVCSPCPEVTAEDLQVDEAPTHYYKALVLAYEKQIPLDLERSISLQSELDDSITELNEVNEALDILKSVGEDVAEELGDTEVEGKKVTDVNDEAASGPTL